MKVKIVNRFLINVIRWLIMRFLVCLSCIIFGATTIFVFSRLTPRNPVEELIARVMSYGAALRADEIEVMRQVITEMFGLDKPLWLQYTLFLKNFFAWDFGPSFIYFPIPVTSIISRYIWWTISLLATVVIISWSLGIIIGIIAAYFEGKKISSILKSIFPAIYPIPYAVFALILFLLFGVLLNVYRGYGGIGFTKPSFSIEFISDVLSKAWLPALSIIVLSSAGWFISTHMLSMSVKHEDYVKYAIIRGLPEKRLLSTYLFRNISLPQVTGLALSLGGIFSGAMATEAIFGYPGLGYLMQLALVRADYNLLMGIACYSIVGVACAAFFVDFIYVFLDPRIRYGFKGE